MRFIFFIFLGLSINFSFSQEICDNAIDDDGDGLIDLNDSLDCNCTFFNPPLPPSLIPNPSFEDTVCCPFISSQLHCAVSWIQASNATSDYFNLCDYSSLGGNHVVPQQPLPGNGNAYVGFFINSNNYKEYVGACLNSPLLAGTSYTISFYTAYAIGNLSADLSIFGTSDCADLPWTSFDCPSNLGNWQSLSSQIVNYTSDGAWQQITMTFTPSVNINAISLGGTCGSVTGFSYYYADELTVNATSLFNSISSEGLYCNGDMVLNINAAGASNYQWYQNGVALIGEIGDSLSMTTYPPGKYSITFDNAGICNKGDYILSPPVYPISNVTIVADSMCVGGAAILLGDSSSTPVPYDSWYFDFQDGSPNSTAFGIFKEYQLPGNYAIKFVTESKGCKDSIEIPISVFPLPAAQVEFTANGIIHQPSQGDTVIVCGTDSIYFNNLSTVTAPSLISTYIWDFGDMNTSTLENPGHQYLNIGFYEVEHVIQTDKGCNDTIIFTIEIKTSPEADFTFNSDYCEGELISFTNTSSIPLGSIVNHSWDFGDFNQSINIDPQHQYITQGNYNVQLVVESDEGCKDSITQPVTIHPKPIADFLISGYCQADTIDFTDQSTVPTGTIDTWQWHFGDGSSSTIQDTSHYYNAPNAYLIELIIETDQGCRDTLDSLYTISPSPQAAFTLEDYCENESIQISNSSSISSGTMSYDWVFENNINSTLNNPPAFSYASAGDYMATLTLTSDQGCVSTLNQNLTVRPTPMAVINEDEITGCSPLRVNLSNQPDPNITNCVWDLGDGTIIEACNFIDHDFESGVYEVTLTVYSQYNCTSSDSKPDFITVTQTPTAAFSYSPQSVSVKDTELDLINNSVGGTSFIWDFGDELGSSTDENPILILPRIATTYAIRLSAISDDGLCEDETVRTIKVLDELLFYVPNSFTPDDNGFNETFTPIMTSGFDIYTYQLTIFNRWGEILFISKDPQVGWDGTYNGESLMTGTYLWQIDYYLVSTDEGVTERGTVNVIR